MPGITVLGGSAADGEGAPCDQSVHKTDQPRASPVPGEVIGDESTYKQFYSGARVMWGF